VAKIALTVGVAAGFAAAGFFSGGLAWTAFTPMEGLLGGAGLGLATGSAIFLRPHIPGQAPLQDLNVSSSAEGAAIPFGYGTMRVPGQLIWSPGITYNTVTQTSGGSGKGANTPVGYVYFSNMAIAFGEGPGTIGRVWADSKLIFKGGLPFGGFSAWSSTQNYVPEDLVSYRWSPGGTPLVSIFQCVVPNSGITPPGNNLYWSDSGYGYWDSTIQYEPGNQVAYPGHPYDGAAGSGNIYACVKPSLNGTPDTSGDWQPLTFYYVAPTVYPGDENQQPDPLIQGVQGVANTPAFRGLIYAVWEDLPLANFGNRVPNLRAEITYS
jgi:hypothetical protein